MRYVQLLFTVCSVVSLTYSQSEQQCKSFSFGATYDKGIPYHDLSSYGYSIHGEYSLSRSFGLLVEYSSLKYSGNDDSTPSINVDVSITAPALFLCWYTPTENPLQLFIGVGAGYTSFKGALSSGSSFMFFGTKPKHFILPQAKLGLHYSFNDHVGLNGNLSFYRLLSVGLDYSL